MECYICHELIRRPDYTRHVRSHLAGNDTGTREDQTELAHRTTLASFSYDPVNYDHHRDRPVIPAHSTPPQLQTRIPLGRHHHLLSVSPNDHHDLDDLEHELSDNRHDPGVHFTSFRFPVRTSAARDRVSVQRKQPTQLNGFQLWLQNPTKSDSPGYTTIDGQKSQSDLQAEEFVQARSLRVTTKQQVIQIVEDFKGLPIAYQQACLQLVRKAPILPGLVAYTYTHLLLCQGRWIWSDDWSSRVSELEHLVERWQEYDGIQCILSYDTMKRRLLELLRRTKVGPGDHKCNSGLLNGTMMLDCDILDLAALAALCITGSQKSDILEQCGGEAEKLVELFNDLLEADVELGEWYRRCLFNALIMFSKKSGYCPHGIYLPEDAINGFVEESQGGFGIVFKARLGSRLVAVKDLKRKCMSLAEYKKELSKEAIIWRHLRHPNCLPFYGVYNMHTAAPNISVALVSPWMSQGTLSEYLKRNPKASRTSLISDIVRGLNYLHSMQPHVAHRDIKPQNILITRTGRACLADFGLVSAFDTDDYFQTATNEIVMGGTYHYMAPEIFAAKDKEAKRHVNKRACDMYALGCTIYAAYTGRAPFDEMSPLQIRASVIRNERPKFPQGKISPDMWSFAENLWDADPLRRLTAGMALGWMEEKALQEGVDLSPALFEEEWEWKRPHDDKCLWSVPI